MIIDNSLDEKLILKCFHNMKCKNDTFVVTKLKHMNRRNQTMSARFSSPSALFPSVLRIYMLYEGLVERRPVLGVFYHAERGGSFEHPKQLLTFKAPIATKVVCFSRLLKCLRSLYTKQCGPRSDCSYRSSLFWVHAACFYI